MKKDADYNIIIGKRSNGKTFFTDSLALTSYLNDGARMAYVRRYAEDITKPKLENKFLAHPIDELTDGNYNGTIYRSRKFRLVKYENSKILYEDDVPFCQTFALSTWERDKGVDHGKFDYIVFDEFMTRSPYLPDEFIMFCNVLSSLLRDRAGTKIFLLGNTVNKYCPYFSEMGLNDLLYKIKQGEILTQVNPATNRAGKLKIAVEYCPDSENTKAVSKYFNFSNPKLECITNGKWEIKNYPRFTNRISKENVITRFYVDFDTQFFCGDIISYEDDVFIHFHNAKREEMKRDSVLYTFEINSNPFHACTIYDGNLKVHDIILDLLKRNKCFYTSNEVGENVRNWLLNQRKYKLNRLS